MVDKETSKAKIRGLVEKYNLHTVKWHKISESDTKSKFLEPLLEHLGWDVKGDKFPDEVIKEERIQQRRADYTLRINGISKLIVEAKAIKEDLDKEAYAKQAIKYAYNKKVSWAALTDFEGLKIFYAEEDSIKPFRNLQLWNIDVFDENFEDIWLLSKDAFISGDLDKKAEREGRKKRSIPIDKQLFQDLNKWRELLSKDIARRYGKKYEDYEVDEIVQRIIDRLIFIRKTEDIGIEENQLMKLKRTSTKNLYKKLKEIFSYYNESYNSKLFGETEEDQHECDNIEISDDTILTVIHGLYYPPGRFVEYDFAAIDADVLGNIYEQYLSHILKKTPKSAKLNDGRTHRKEQGIYYTPTYIVDYIVRNTLGELLKDKKVKPDEIRILDPACGSGSFLLKAFDFMNEYYNKKQGRSHQTQLDESGIFTRKAQILDQNIFGVDLDSKAVEIAQLNLLLKLLEDKRRLPTLKDSIRCGNSLVDSPQLADNKSFDWWNEFSEVFDSGGFDIIIGNPPYVQLSMEEDTSDSLKNYLMDRYGSSMGRLNTYGFFIKLGIDVLRDGGILGFIVPNTILTQDYYEELRIIILDSCEIKSIVSFSELPFKDAVVENVILILKKSKLKRNRLSTKISIFNVDEGLSFVKQREINQLDFFHNYKKGFNLSLDERSIKLKNKINSDSVPLGDVFEINQAIALKHNRAQFLSNERHDENYKKVIDGKNIARYSLNWGGIYLKYDVSAIHSCKREDIFLSDEKIFFRRVGDKLIATLDNENFYALNTLVVMNKKSNEDTNIRYYLGLFNSKLLNYYYQHYLKSTKKVFSEIQARQIKELPIKSSSETNTKLLIHLVERMMEFNKKLKRIGEKKTEERKKLDEEIKKSDDKINKLVYDIYGLTNKEREIIESSSN